MTGAGHDLETWRETGAILAVFLLLAAALWTLRRRAGCVRPRGSKTLQTMERIALTPQHALHLIRAPGRELLVATHPQGCSLLFEQASESAPATESALRMPAQSAECRSSDPGSSEQRGSSPRASEQGRPHRRQETA